MRLSRLLALLVASQLIATAAAQQNPQVPTVDLTVEVVGSKVAEFSAKMDGYAQLRASLQEGLPPLKITDNPKEIQIAERALAERIRAAESSPAASSTARRPIASAS